MYVFCRNLTRVKKVCVDRFRHNKQLVRWDASLHKDLDVVVRRYPVLIEPTGKHTSSLITREDTLCHDSCDHISWAMRCRKFPRKARGAMLDYYRVFSGGD